MPIFSRNSLGSNVKITANENYSYTDMGRILSECVQNDMTLFNAVLLNDFRENSAIREGTMVSSELTSFREFSAKEAWDGLKKKLKKLWEKIKGVFNQVYAKMTVWFVRYGKAFVAANRKILANKTGLDDCKIPVFYRIKIAPNKFSKVLKDKVSEGFKDFKVDYSDDEDKEVDSDTTLELLLGAILGKHESVSASEFAEEYKDLCVEEIKDKTYKEIKNKGADYNKLFADITGKGEAIKDLKKLRTDIEDSIKKAMNIVDKASKEEKETNAYKNATKAISAFERAATMVTKNGISVIRNQVSNARQIVGKLVAYNPTKESAVLEMAAWCEGADDFAEVDDIPAEEINADDVQSDPDVEVNINVDDDGNECTK